VIDMDEVVKEAADSPVRVAVQVTVGGCGVFLHNRIAAEIGDSVRPALRAIGTHDILRRLVMGGDDW